MFNRDIDRYSYEGGLKDVVKQAGNENFLFWENSKKNC